MVIASIDIQNGEVVQLKQGAELALRRDDAPCLAEEFNRCGEIAVIDLDAAMGKGSNLEIIKPLLRKAECRVGGGIRTPEQARELVSLGAKKIIVGSATFRDPSKKGAGAAGGEFAVNISFLESMAKKIGRERLIAAVDARNGEITVDGWKTPTGIKLLDAAKIVEPYVSELLFTCVEREGMLSGADLALARALRETVGCAVTVAGGVSTLDEITRLADIGCDVQLGMALYTKKINLAEAFIASLNWNKGRGEVSPPAANQPQADGLLNGSPLPPSAGCPTEHARRRACCCDDVTRQEPQQVHHMTENDEGASPPATPPSLLPIIIQSPDGQTLMTGFTDARALAETFKRGNVCLHSRGRNKLWMKGETSGNTLKLISMRADCDRDALLAIAEPVGPVCHTGAWSCFKTDRNYTWEFLQEIIAERFRNPAPGSYTATLDNELVREKVTEEARELCEAKTRDEIIWEAADLLYFATVLMTRAGVTVKEILDELDWRHKK